MHTVGDFSDLMVANNTVSATSFITAKTNNVLTDSELENVRELVGNIEEHVNYLYQYVAKLEAKEKDKQTKKNLRFFMDRMHSNKIPMEMEYINEKADVSAGLILD